MDFIEWLKNQEEECNSLIRSKFAKSELFINEADFEANKKRAEKLAAALNLYDEFKERG